MKNHVFLFIPLIWFFASFTLPTPSGEKIIRQMHKKWKGKWGRNMRFDQKVFLYKNDSLIKEEVWQEVLSSPYNLQIRFNGFETGNGIIFRNDSVYHFSEGELIKTEDRVHHLLLLGFDVFFLKPEETIEKLNSMGFDLNKTYTIETNTGEVIVVGAGNAADTTSSQFWIKKEELYLEKVILNRNNNLSEVEMTNYAFIDGYPVATVILFRNNGELYMKEEYFDISFPRDVDPEIFDPENFNNLKW